MCLAILKIEMFHNDSQLIFCMCFPPTYEKTILSYTCGEVFDESFNSEIQIYF